MLRVRRATTSPPPVARSAASRWGPPPSRTETPCSSPADPGARWTGPNSPTQRLDQYLVRGSAGALDVDGADVNMPNVGAATGEPTTTAATGIGLRLAKSAYDPHHVFRFEQSVPLE